MKKSKITFLAVFFLLFIAVITPSCEIIMAVLEESSQVDNNNTEKNDDADANGRTSKPKT